MIIRTINSKGIVAGFQLKNSQVMLCVSVHRKLSLWICDKDRVPPEGTQLEAPLGAGKPVLIVRPLEIDGWIMVVFRN